MADRHAHPSRNHTAGVSKARSAMASTAHGVRRNLFQSQLTRWPTARSSTPSEELHLDDDAHNEHQQHQHHAQFKSQPQTAFPQDDIVVRDHNGEVELGDPPTPTIDNAEDLEALEAWHENETERQRLADAVKQHQIDQHSVPSQPEGKDPFCSPSSKCSTDPAVRMTKTKHFPSTTELLEAVKASLRAKVAALGEDNWLYEPEPPQHHHQ